MWGMYPLVPAYKEGDYVFRKADDVKMVITDYYKTKVNNQTVESYKLEVVVDGGGGNYCWVKLEELQRDYTKEEPYAAQKAVASKDGFIWKDKLE
jgi:hypothetical protein